MVQNDFQREYKVYCKSNDLASKTLKKDYFQGPFLKRNLTVEKATRLCPVENVPKINIWIFGVRIMRDDALL